ncbi:MAG TPA: hypothetical protein VLB80_00775 [Candidatus Babeliales bacterium]|nr:hypothetical protein [Candidatus Babeliales bacterium]
MKHIAVQLFFLSLSPCLYSMGLIPSLQNNPSHQAVMEKSKEYYTKTLPSLSLSTIGDNYYELSSFARTKLINNMSEQLLTLHGIALLLPEEIRKNILEYMLDEDRNAVELFYKMPILEAFTVYSDIQKRLTGNNTSIASLFKSTLEERELVLRLMEDNSCCLPIISVEESEMISRLDKNIINDYLQGRQTTIYYTDAHDPCVFRNPCIATGLLAILDIIGGGTIFGVFLLAGAPKGVSLMVALGCMFLLFPCIGCMVYIKGGYRNRKSYSHRIII